MGFLSGTITDEKSETCIQKGSFHVNYEMFLFVRLLLVYFFIRAFMVLIKNLSI